MSDKAAKAIKIKGMSAIAAIAIGSTALIAAWMTWGQPLTRRDPLSASESGVSLGSTEQTAPAPVVASAPTALPTNTLTLDTTLAHNPSNSATQHGLLRVGNLTEHPVRLAVLLKQAPQTAKTKAGAMARPGYEPPAHWDFAPGEGGSKGLVLSLPQRSLKLKPGDIVVAFAQDGSRRYWGPFVIGETEMPVWDAKTTEWQLLLTP